MKKGWLILFFLVASLGLVLPVRAQEAIPEVLAVTKSPARLPKVVASENVVVTGTENQDVVVLGSKIAIFGTINGNLLVLGRTVIIEPGAHISGYMIIGGERIEILGRVDGEMRAMGNQVIVGDKASVGGNLWVDATKISVSDRARVGGEKKINEIKANGRTATGFRQGWTNVRNQVERAWGFFSIIGFLGKILLMLILVRVFGKQIAKLTKLATEDFWLTLLSGLVKLVLTPIAIVLLLITIIGIPVALAVLLAFGLSIFLAEYISAAVLGQVLVMKGWLKNDNPYLQAVAGLAALGIIAWIPFVGWLVKFVAFLIGLGLVIRWEMAFWKGKRIK